MARLTSGPFAWGPFAILMRSASDDIAPCARQDPQYWGVLIQHLRQVVDALDVRPGEALGKLRRVDVLVGTGADDVLALIVAGHPLERVEHLGLGVRGAGF